MSLQPDEPAGRPVLHCLVGFFDPDTLDVIGVPKPVPIEDVPAYLRVGFWAIGPDPGDVIALADWERAHPPNPWIWQGPQV